MNNNFQPANAAAGGFAAPMAAPVPVAAAPMVGFAGPAPLPPSPVVCVIEIVTTPKWINEIFMPNWQTVQNRPNNPGGWLLGGPVVNRAGGTRTRPIQALQFAVHPYNLSQVMRTKVFEKAKVRALFHPSLEAGAAPGATVLSPYREGVLAAMAAHLTRQGNPAQAAMFTTAQGFIDAERGARAAAAARPVEVEDEEEFANLNNEGNPRPAAAMARPAPKVRKPRSKKAVALTVAPDEDEDEYAEASEGGNNNNENYVEGGAGARVRVKKQPSAEAAAGGGGAPPVMAAVPLPAPAAEPAPAPVPDAVASQEEAVLTESQEFAMTGLAAAFGAGLNMNPVAGGFARMPEAPEVTAAAKSESQQYAEQFGDIDLGPDELAQLFGYAPARGGSGGGGAGGAYRRRTRRLRRAGRKSRKSRR
jgi:hypothetical protein